MASGTSIFSDETNISPVGTSRSRRLLSSSPRSTSRASTSRVGSPIRTKKTGTRTSRPSKLPSISSSQIDNDDIEEDEGFEFDIDEDFEPEDTGIKVTKGSQGVTRSSPKSPARKLDFGEEEPPTSRRLTSSKSKPTLNFGKTSSSRPMTSSKSAFPSTSTTSAKRSAKIVRESPVRSSALSATERSRSATVKSSVKFEENDARVSETQVKRRPAEDLLISNGYLPIKNITEENGKGDYILAINKRGQYVLVNTNDKDVSRTERSVMVRSEHVKSSNIPHSIQRGSLECASGVCGVAFDNGKQLNLITRDDNTLSEHTQTLTYVSDNIASLGDNVPFPIINYNDIVHNPNAILRNTDETTIKLQRHAYHNCKHSILDAAKEFKTLEDALRRNIALEEHYSKMLSDSMIKLRKIANQYEMTPPQNEEEAEKYNLIRFNLRRRNELFAYLIHTCSQMAEMKMQLRDMTKKIRETHELCERNFSGADKIMYP
jgi:hypothetical protein